MRKLRRKIVAYCRYAAHSGYLPQPNFDDVESKSAASFFNFSAILFISLTQKFFCTSSIRETACPKTRMRGERRSPWIVQRLLRSQDRLRLFELHSSDSELPQDNFRARGSFAQRRTHRRLRGTQSGIAAAPAPWPGANRSLVRGQERLQQRRTRATRRTDFRIS